MKTIISLNISVTVDDSSLIILVGAVTLVMVLMWMMPDKKIKNMGKTVGKTYKAIKKIKN